MLEPSAHFDTPLVCLGVIIDYKMAKVTEPLLSAIIHFSMSEIKTHITISRALGDSGNILEKALLLLDFVGALQLVLLLEAS